MQPTTEPTRARRHRRPPADPSLLRKVDAAVALGVTRPRISQLIRNGQLQPRPDGLITAEEVDRCRRCEPIAWQPDYMKTNYQRPQS
jgi:hypothetical protein